MKRIKRILLHISFFISILFITCCSRDIEIPDISLPPTPVLSVKTNWGVIDSSYLRLREKPDKNSKPVTTLWGGNVLEIVSRSAEKQLIDNEYGYWYQINYDGLQGWVFGAYLNLYDSKEKAERASRKLK